MNRKPMLLFGSVFLIACGSGFADERGPRLFQPAMPFSDNLRQDTVTLYVGHTGVLRRYALAIAADRRAIATRRDVPAYGHGFAGRQIENGVRTFVGPDGAHVVRLGSEALIIGRGVPLANLYAEIDCEIKEWPALICKDGRRRTISAPDATTIRIEGETFELAEPQSNE